MDTTTPNSVTFPPRHLLWVDGIGGFLICLSHRNIFGAFSQEGQPDIPLLADISRQHALIERDSEGYFLEAYRPVKVNHLDAKRVPLAPGDRITLGNSCQLLFSQTIPVSATARLDVVSGHRLGLHVQSVLLMADTLVFSPQTNAHIHVPELSRPLILFRQQNQIGVRFEGTFSVGGVLVKDRSPLHPGRPLEVGELSMTLEMIQGRSVCEKSND